MTTEPDVFVDLVVVVGVNVDLDGDGDGDGDLDGAAHALTLTPAWSTSQPDHSDATVVKSAPEASSS